MKIDEYTPETMPTSSARANSRSETAPNNPDPTSNSEITGRIEAKLVSNERIITWFIEMFTMSSYSILVLAKRPSFSFTRSKTTIVS